MLRKKGFKTLSSLLSIAMLALGMTTGMAQVAQAANLLPEITPTVAQTAFNTPVVFTPTTVNYGVNLTFCLVDANYSVQGSSLSAASNKTSTKSGAKTSSKTSSKSSESSSSKNNNSSSTKSGSGSNSGENSNSGSKGENSGSSNTGSNGGSNSGSNNSGSNNSGSNNSGSNNSGENNNGSNNNGSNNNGSNNNGSNNGGSNSGSNNSGENNNSNNNSSSKNKGEGTNANTNEKANYAAKENAPEARFDAASANVGLKAAACRVGGLYVRGQGTWTVNSTTGEVRFVPVSTFSGQTTPVKYQATDSIGSSVVSVAVNVAKPVGPSVAATLGTTTFGTPVTVTPAVTGSNIVWSSACLVDPTDSTLCSNALIVAGEGIYTTNRDGSVTFTPDAAFAGNATPITYQIADRFLQIGSATISIAVGNPDAPEVTSQTAQTSWNQPVQFSPEVNGEGVNFVHSCLIDPADHVCKKTISVDGQGVWYINTFGQVTFTPDENFTGTTDPVSYQVADDYDRDGGRCKSGRDCDRLIGRAPVRVHVAKPGEPSARPAVANTPFNTPVSLAPTINGQNIDYSKSCLVDPIDGICKTRVVTAGKGTWTIQGSSGSVLFTPLPTFAGTTSSLVYRAYDTFGQFTQTTVRVHVNKPAAPVVGAVSETTTAGTPITFTPPVSGLTIDLSSACITDPADGVCKKTVTIDGQGTFVVNNDGSVTFTPADGFVGSVEQVSYHITSAFGGTSYCVEHERCSTNSSNDCDVLLANGNHEYNEGEFSEHDGTSGTYSCFTSGSSTINVLVAAPNAPVVDPVVRTTPFNVPVTVYPVVSGSPIDHSQTCLIDPADGGCKNTVVLLGRGTWTLNPSNGAATFTPFLNFAGTTPAITYVVTDVYGLVGQNTIQVNVLQPGKLARDGVTNATTPFNTPITFMPTVQGYSLDFSTACITDPADGLCKTTVSLAEGTFVVDTTNGQVTFTPAIGFAGVVPAVNYHVQDRYGSSNGEYCATHDGHDGHCSQSSENECDNFALSSDETTYCDLDVKNTLRVVVLDPGAPTVDPVHVTTPYRTAVTVTPDVHVLVGDSVDYSRTCLIDPVDNLCKTTVVSVGQGTWTIDTTTGAATFTPYDNFVGDVTPILYRAYDSFGKWGQNAIYVTVLQPEWANDGKTDVTTKFNTAKTFSTTATGQNLLNSTACLVDPADDVCKLSVTITGEGTYTVDTTTGEVTFTPVDGFTGTASSITYRIVDGFGLSSNPVCDVLNPNCAAPADNICKLVDPSAEIGLAPANRHPDCLHIVNNVITVTVELPTPPVVDPVVTKTPFNTTIDAITPNVTGYQIQPASACLVDPTDNTKCVTTVVIAGQGTFTVNIDGTVTFVPEDGFVGAVDTVTYRAFDVFGQSGENTIDVTVSDNDAPTVDPVTDTTDYKTDITVTPTVHGWHIDATKACLVDGFDCVTTLTVPGEGTYVVNVDGSVTFTPADGFAGVATPVTYRATDGKGKTGENTITITVNKPSAPSVAPVEETTNYKTDITVTPTVTGEHIDVTKDCLVDPADSTQCVTTLTITGQGTFTVNADGSVTFSPADGFAGTVDTVTYRAFDKWGQSGENTIIIHVRKPAKPTVNPGGGSNTTDPNNGGGTSGTGANFKVITPYMTPVGITPAIDGTKLDLTSVCLVDPVAPHDCVQTDIVTDEGTWSINVLTGEATFTPADGFTGNVTPIDYCVSDAFGQQGCGTLNVEVLLPAAPTVDPVDTTTPYFTPKTVTPSVTGTKIDPTKACIVDGSNCVKTLTIVGQGTYDVNVDGSVTFTPIAGFAGNVTTITYRATDGWGQTATNTIDIEVLKPSAPAVDPVVDTTPYNTPIDVTPGVTGEYIQDANACLVDPTDSTKCVKTVTIAGQGTFTVNNDGSVTFAPVDTFAGVVDTVTYRAFDKWGQSGQNTISITVTKPDAPSVDPVDTTTNYNTAKDVTPTVHGTKIDATKACIIDPADGQCKTTVTISGQGTFVVANDGSVTFTPVAHFAGLVDQVTYRAEDIFGQTATGTIDVEVLKPVAPSVAAVVTTTPYDTNVTVTPVITADANDTIVVADTCIVDPADSQCKKSVTIAAEGTWTVNSDGSVTFNPAASFIGVTSAIVYQITDEFGQTATNTITITVEDTTDPTVDAVVETTPFNTAITVAPTVHASYQVDGSMACIIDPADGNCKRTVYILNQGKFEVQANGSVKFTPDYGFTGAVDQVTYVAYDGPYVGNTYKTGSNTIDITVEKPAAPVVGDDSKTTAYITAVTLSPTVTGTDIAPLKACLVDPTDSTICTRDLVVAGEGEWVVNNDGTVTFTPAAHFTGTTTVITYRAFDVYDQTDLGDVDGAADGEIYVTVSKPSAPSVAPVVTTTPYLTDKTVTPVVTGTYIVPANACIVDGQNCVTTLTITGQGTYTVNSDGSVTFSPVSGFAGAVNTITYRAFDEFGQSGENTIDITVEKPAGPSVNPPGGNTNAPKTETINGEYWLYTPYVTAVSITPEIIGTDVNPNTACLVDPTDSTVCTKSPITTSQGTWTLGANGLVTFTPADGFTGAVTDMTYCVTDPFDQVGCAVIHVFVDKPAGPSVNPSGGTNNTDPNNGGGTSGTGANFKVITPYLTPVTITPALSGTKVDPSTVCLIDPVAPHDCVQTPIVTDQGTWTIDPTTGGATFTPADGFTGNVTPIDYCVTDAFDQQGCGTLNVEVLKPAGPSVNPSGGTNNGGGTTGSGANYTVLTPFDTNVDITPKLDGTKLDLTTICLVDTSDGICKTTVITPQGKWTVDPTTGKATFDPTYGFTGNVDPIEYCVTDFFGQEGCGTLNVKVGEPTPPSLAGPAKQTIAYNTSTTLQTVATKGSGAIVGYCIIDPLTGKCSTDTNGDLITNEGTWSIDVNGKVTFVAAVGFAGVATSITVQLIDDLGYTAEATVEVEVLEPAAPVVDPATVYTPFNTPITFQPVITGLAIDLATACVVDPADNICKKTVVVAGQGTWTVNSTTGEVTFTPEAGFSGNAEIEYHVSNIFNKTAKAKMTVVVAPSGFTVLDGVVWLDVNGNGLQDAGEPGLPGVLVSASNTTPASLRAAGVNAAAVTPQTTRTDKNGFYTFEVAPGKYEVKALLTSSYMYESYAKDPVTKAIISNPNWTANVEAATNKSNIANFAAAGNGSMAGTVKIESGAVVPKAQVQCTWAGFDGILGTADDVLITATADAKGNFALSGIPGGTFKCGGTDPRNGKKAAPATTNVAGTKSPTQKPKATKVVLPIKIGGKVVYTVKNFVPGSPKLTAAIKATIDRMTKKYKYATSIAIDGFTMGPTVLKVDYNLSLNRAKNAYNRIKFINNLITLIRIRNIQEGHRVGDNIRRVRITMYW